MAMRGGRKQPYGGAHGRMGLWSGHSGARGAMTRMPNTAHLYHKNRPTQASMAAIRHEYGDGSRCRGRSSSKKDKPNEEVDERQRP